MDGDEADDESQVIAFHTCLCNLREMLSTAYDNHTPFPARFYEFLDWNGRGLTFVKGKDYVEFLADQGDLAG